MSVKNDGGPAFPGDPRRSDDGEIYHSYNEGMTLRDHFAGLAMQGILANPATRGAGEEMAANLAEVVYDLADFMLAERAK